MKYLVLKVSDENISWWKPILASWHPNLHICELHRFWIFHPLTFDFSINFYLSIILKSENWGKYVACYPKNLFFNLYKTSDTFESSEYWVISSFNRFFPLNIYHQWSSRFCHQFDYQDGYNHPCLWKQLEFCLNNGPRVVRKDYVLWKIQNMQESASMPSSSGQSQFSIISLVALKLELKN